MYTRTSSRISYFRFSKKFVDISHMGVYTNFSFKFETIHFLSPIHLTDSLFCQLHFFKHVYRLQLFLSCITQKMWCRTLPQVKIIAVFFLSVFIIILNAYRKYVIAFFCQEVCAFCFFLINPTHLCALSRVSYHDSVVQGAKREIHVLI